jgi:hypothetical protein
LTYSLSFWAVRRPSRLCGSSFGCHLYGDTHAQKHMASKHKSAIGLRLGASTVGKRASVAGRRKGLSHQKAHIRKIARLLVCCGIHQRASISFSFGALNAMSSGGAGRRDEAGFAGIQWSCWVGAVRCRSRPERRGTAAKQGVGPCLRLVQWCGSQICPR